MTYLSLKNKAMLHNNIVRFQKINEYAERHGFLSGFPIFDEKGDDDVIGSMLLSDKQAHKRFVHESEFEGHNIKDIPSMFRAVNDYAKRNGYAAAFPSFQTADDGKGLLIGTILIRQDKSVTKEISKKELGIESAEDVPSMMKAAHNYAIKNGFVTGFPTFHENGVHLTIPIVLFWFDIPIKRDVRPYWDKQNLTNGKIFHGDRYITIEQFADDFQRELEGKVLKYAFVIRYKLSMASRAAGKKNNGPDDFTIDSRYNPASVTKTFTATALLQLLENKSLTIDDLIWQWLPPDWNTLPVRNITFRQVLTHSAGFPLPSVPDNVYYNDIRNVIEAGPNTIDTHNDKDALLGTWRYKNVNFGICRILVAFLDGYDPLTHINQSEGTSSHFINYLQRNIFDTLNIPNVEFKPPSTNATLFFDPDNPSHAGTDYGDWSLQPGSAGVHLSTREIADFIYLLNLDNTFLSDHMKSQMKSLKLGWDDRNSFENDQFVYKGGYFPGATLHSGIYLFENGLQLTFVFNGETQYDAIHAAYTQSWMHSNPF